MEIEVPLAVDPEDQHAFHVMRVLDRAEVNGLEAKSFHEFGYPALRALIVTDQRYGNRSSSGLGIERACICRRS